MEIDPATAAHAKIAFGALCGGILRLLFRPADSFLKSIWLLFGCVTCGFYATPSVVAYFDLQADYAGAVGALLGFVGLSFAEGLLRFADGFDFAKLLERFTNTKPGA
jgi:hypothetical protein